MEARYPADEATESIEQRDGAVVNDGQPNLKPPSDAEAQAPAETARETSETIRSESHREKGPETPTVDASASPAVNDQPVASVDHTEQRGAEDDGGEVMEDNEDTVIY